MNELNIPLHIAIIPDGNRRWAVERHLSIFKGHQVAVEKTLPQLIEKSQQLGIKYFSFWAFSTENLADRSKQEVNHLLDLMRYFLKEKMDELDKKKMKIRIIGDTGRLPKDIQKKLKEAVEKTKKNRGMTVVLALNYSGRDEIIRAIKKVKNEKLKMKNLNKEKFGDFLDTAGIPDPDLIIRTGKEKRLSGFMLWQSEYSELYFSNLYFPDFGQEALKKTISDFKKRKRRFGK